jgi:hypothetical protein
VRAFKETDGTPKSCSIRTAVANMEAYAKPQELQFIPPISGILEKLATRRTKQQATAPPSDRKEVTTHNFLYRRSRCGSIVCQA